MAIYQDTATTHSTQLTLDMHLTFKPYLNQVRRNVPFKLKLFRKIRHLMTEQAALTIAKSMIIPVIDYGNAFLAGCLAADLEDLDVIQNNSLRCALNIFNPRDIHIDQLREDVKIPNKG